MKIFFWIVSFSFLFYPLKFVAGDISLEEEIKTAFEDYPFECNRNGSTPEMAACVWIELIKSDRKLRQELNNKELFSRWTKARNELCNYFQDKMYSGGTIRQITRPGCAIRVNKEIQKYCLKGDPTCG